MLDELSAYQVLNNRIDDTSFNSNVGSQDIILFITIFYMMKKENMAPGGRRPNR
jgi:hypothetical protein